MATLGSRVAERDRETFVGREAEVAAIQSALDGASATRVVKVVGPGGIGKSALLREVSRRAVAAGYAVLWIDGRDISPFPDALERALETARPAGPVLLVFDSYDRMASLDSHLRNTVIPELPDTTVVVFASRHQPSAAWFEHGWNAVVQTIELTGLDASAAAELARRHGVREPTDVDELVRRSRGSPLAVVIGAQAGPAASVAELAARLVGEEVDAAHHRVLTVASLARATTPQMLAEVLGDEHPEASYAWLAERSFAEPLSTGVTLHSVVAEAVRTRAREIDPIGEAALRRAIADHLHARAVAGDHGMSIDLQHLIVDPKVRWGFAADVGNRYRIDSVRPGDVELVGSILESVGVVDWWRITRVFFEWHPEHVGIARDPTGAVGGYFIAAAPQWAPAAAETDPLLGPWLHYARTELSTDRAVIWREAVDLTGEMGEITSLLGAGGLVASGVRNPRFGFLPISPLLPAARAFSESLDATHLPELDVDSHGMQLECHLVDFGPTGLLGFQRNWIYRESGAPAPAPAPDSGHGVDPVQLLKCLREPAELANGPSWLGDTPAERLAELRRRAEAALGVFGTTADEELARQVIRAAFLDRGAPHESIARRLHVSRSAYFRRLHAASVRVGNEILAGSRSGRKRD